MIRYIIKLTPLLFLLAACASPQNRLARTPEDPSRPTVASIYYYLSASLLHYDGDFVSAAQLYARAAEQDPTSLQIKKQALINSAYAYLNNQQDEASTLADFALARETGKLDSDQLNAAYSVYSQANNEEGWQWVIDESIARYPSARAYLQKFYFDHERKGLRDEKPLEQAYKLAQNNPEDLVLTARMYSLINPKRGISILKRANQLAPKAETSRLLNDFLLQYGSPEEQKKQFQSYVYPEDRDLMLHMIQSATKNKALATVLSLQDEIVKTADASLLAELAFAAYLEADTAALNKIAESLRSKNPEPETDAKIAVFLLAEALFSDALPAPKNFTGYLYSVQDADDLMLYRTLRQSLLIQSGSIGASPDFYSDLAKAAQAKLPAGALQSYLLAASHAVTSADSTLSAARTVLCKEYVDMGRGYEVDWSTLLTDFHLKGNYELKLPLLRQAISKFPNNPLFLNDLGYSLLDSADTLLEGGVLISRAIALEPDSAYYQDSMAWYYYLMGDFANALIHIQIPQKLENPPAEIAYHIGMILMVNNDSTAAIPFFKTAINDPQSGEYNDKARAALKSIGVEP